MKARLACSLTSLEREELGLTVAAWLEVLEAVPDYALNECYRRAIRHHDGRGPFGASAIARAWESLGEAARRELLSANVQPALGGEQCVRCKGDKRRLMRVLRDGTPIEWNDPRDTGTVTHCMCLPTSASGLS